MVKKTLRRLLACVLTALLCAAVFPVPASAEGGDYYESELPPEENPDALIPEGNMDLVSDITGEAANEKEFLTVVSKNGNYFYIIIDRSGKGGNTVHFLNQVDEADLLALLSEEELEDYAQRPEPAPTPEPAPDPSPEPETPPADSDGKDGARAAVLIVLFGALGVLVFLYFRSKKTADPSKGVTDLDDYDFGDDEDEDDELYAKFDKYAPNSEVDGS